MLLKGQSSLKRDSDSQLEAYAKLGIAVVEQAAKDALGYSYTNGNRKPSTEWGKARQINEVKQFFYDPEGLFVLCMPSTDGPTFYEKILSNYEKYGNYVAPGQGGVYL